VAAPISTSRATVDDVDTLLEDVQVGFDSYTEFAPPGWEPPDVSVNREFSVLLLRDPETWALLAFEGADPIGHIAFFPGRERRLPDQPPGNWESRRVVPGLAHLWQLFVLPRWWGRGVAPLLHDAAIGEMRSRGYEHGRLFTPSLHIRARRFYERRGWTVAEELWNDQLALMLTEYRISLR
jgi:GNAT superfamily N-acetyltransferase